ncbi:S-adenosylmethionine:tRNA ribosyltransferase-isomerase [Sediminibacterium soli]|uniref:S-adenosylmethionine:tRNA ribosyltransferase-isomerase n=1 Tax=Sediminibacterium soli TaxID=2698829 RepID=UPI00137B4675|nr:S-adenosylmethionine:tRNA ribosyltransferase-isomerase [Sediminibacterium soli]NCI48036.1 S-adenosylmethionine:tRNA ribosyltransferase-isomerase [Sediminibacterium soli]
MHPRFLSIRDFTYELPEERIARYPLPQRDQSKLLVWKKGLISENSYASVADEIPEGSLLVFNNTKVVEARLQFRKPGGDSIIEIFCLEPGSQYADITTAMLQKGSVTWKCLVGGAKKWKEGRLANTVNTAQRSVTLTATKLEKNNDHYLIELSWDDTSLSFAELLHLAGAIPLPPYLNRAAEASDKERYQTIYARHDGSVAAPTAGLHFTDTVFQSLKKKGIGHEFVTLHVGAGTFKPVKSETMQDHDMHSEFIDVTAACIEHILQQLPGKIIAVGTTSLRTIESLFWLGRKVLADERIQPEALFLSQWEAYEIPAQENNARTALQGLLDWMKKHQCSRLLTKTQIIIAPGYTFRIVGGLITNFHQPQSTLLLLVAAITGKEWKTVYGYALQHGFRFLSYGDGSLLWV